MVVTAVCSYEDFSLGLHGENKRHQDTLLNTNRWISTRELQYSQ